MQPISRGEELSDYTSFDLQWLGPIVFPLSFALPTIFFVLYKLASDNAPRGAASVFSLGITFCEAIFAICCFAQCIANYSSRSFSGGDAACRLQGFYATFYLFTSMPLAACAALTTAGRVTTARTAGLLCGACFALGLLLAGLPLEGAGRYRFPKDYCMCDLEQPVFAVCFLVAIVGSALSLLFNSHTAATAQENRLPLLAVVAPVVSFVAFYATPLLITMIYVGQGSQPGTIYGANAIILHLQQVVNPLLYGIYWRQQVVAAATTAEDADTGLDDNWAHEKLGGNRADVDAAAGML